MATMIWIAVVLWLVTVGLGCIADRLEGRQHHAAARWTSLTEAIMCMLATAFTVGAFLS